MNPVRLLFVLAVALPVAAFWPHGQDPAGADWQKDVDNACRASRYGLRLAAGRKVAAAGDAAVPAIRAFAQQHGNDQIPMTLVELIAEDRATGPLTLALLRDWSDRREFYWRGSAMRGLALRAKHVGADEQAELRTRFPRFHQDDAWLMRTHARLGSVLLGERAVLELPEPDPRARTRLHAQLLLQGVVPPLQPLLDALADERTCLGIPWGQNSANEAHKALKQWLGDAHPLAKGGEFPDAAAGIAALQKVCAEKSGQTLTIPSVRRDEVPGLVGGFEFLSCKHGDLFVQWTDAGALWFGVDAAKNVQIPAARWQELSRERSALPLGGNLGVVICDSMRVKWTGPDVDARVAPSALPVPVVDWLKRLAAAIEEARESRLAADLLEGLEQFAAR